MNNDLIHQTGKMIVISVVGHPASGKDTVADYLAERGFVKISSSDFLRAEMKKIGLPLDRPAMQKFVSEMRQKYGNGYPAIDIVESIHANTVVSGFRNTQEVKTLHDAFGGNFRVIAVETPSEIRYQWSKERNRVGDNISYEDFLAAEALEKAAQSGVFEVDAVIEMADIKFINNSTKEDLFRRVDEFVSGIKN